MAEAKSPVPVTRTGLPAVTGSRVPSRLQSTRSALTRGITAPDQAVWMRAARLAAFSDGVFSIAAMLLVLDITVHPLFRRP